jgi:NADH-quinone oxidoreductase subunit C
MDSDALVALLQEALPGVPVEATPSIDLHQTFYVSRDDVPAVMQVLRDRPDLGFTFLAELTAVDHWPREPRFELVYILVALERAARLRLKVRLPGEDPHITTLSGLFPVASWLEREVWDMFGIAFDGHPDPRRLLMPEDWEGFPLRKDYPLQIRKETETGSALQVTEQEFRANVMKDRLVRPDMNLRK